MELKEEKAMDEQVGEKMIPVFTVLKNGAILKNIFVVNSRDFSSPERNGNAVSDDDEVEEVLVVGRHPDCDILLTHPSISRYHLEIRSVPSRQKLFLTDLSSVHGTWVTDQRVEPGACVELKEGDVIRIGGSTRIYRLHWIPLSRAYDMDNPFVSPLDASTTMEQEEDARMLEAENLELAHQSLRKTTPGDDGDRDLDVTSEGTGSSVPSEDEDTYTTTEGDSLPLASPSVLALARDSVKTQKLEFNEDFQTSSTLDLDVVEAPSEKPRKSCYSSKQQRSGYPEVLGFSEIEVAAEADESHVGGDGVLYLNEMSERMQSSGSSEHKDPFLTAKQASPLPLPRDPTEIERLQLTKDVQALPELAKDIIEANTESSSSGYSPSKGQTEGCIEASCCSAFELAAMVETLRLCIECNGDTEFVTKQVMEASAKPLTKDVSESHEDNGERETEVSRQVTAVSPNSFPQSEPTLEILTEDARSLLGCKLQSEVAIETDGEKLHQKSNGEAKVCSGKDRAVSDCLFTGNENLSKINTKDSQNESPSWQPLPENEVGAPSEICNEVNPAGDQYQTSGMNRETEKLFDEGSSSCLPEDLGEKSGKRSTFLLANEKPEIEMSIGSGRFEECYNLSETEGERNTNKGIRFPSTLGAETFEDTKPMEDLPCDYTGSQENQTPAVRDDVLSEIDSSRSSSRRLSTCNIWSRRGKDASVLQIRTIRSEGKQKKFGNQPKAQLQRKQVLNEKSISLTGAEKLEPEIFTPDKENLTPSTHMLKRLQDSGDTKDSKLFSKLSGRSCSSKIPSNIDIITSGGVTEPEIFTPDKENLTPNSHMLKRLREVGDIKESNLSTKATRKPFSTKVTFSPDIHLEEKVMADLQGMSSKSKVVAPTKNAERAPFQPLLEKSAAHGERASSCTASARNNNISRGIRSPSILSEGKSKMKWTIVLDTSSLLDMESRKPLRLLQGLKGTRLVVPRTVLREVNERKRSCSGSLVFRRRRESACSAVEWIEECMVNSEWWIQLQSPSEESKAIAATPPVSPQRNESKAFPFSLQWNNNAGEIVSPTSEDQVLECALVYRNRNRDEKVVLLSNDATLKIKAMAEGVICETAHELYESLVNPLSDRFMWRESLARGRTWSAEEDVVLRERYKNRTCFPGGRRAESAKGLKLILLHNTHYAHSH